MASAAVDGDDTTASCTSDSMEHPWWAVDLGQAYSIGSVVITVPQSTNDDYSNYRLSCFVR